MLCSALRDEISRLYHSFRIAPRLEDYVFCSNQLRAAGQPKPLCQSFVDRMTRRYFSLSGIVGSATPNKGTHTSLLGTHSFRAVFIRRHVQQRDDSPEAVRELAKILHCTPASLRWYYGHPVNPKDTVDAVKPCPPVLAVAASQQQQSPPPPLISLSEAQLVRSTRKQPSSHTSTEHDAAEVKRRKNVATRHVPRAQEHRLLRRQEFACANRPGSAVRRYLQNYACLLWDSKRNGVFDSSGFQCDHDIQWSSGIADVNDDANLQLLCPNCHNRKTQIDQEREARILAAHRDQLSVDIVQIVKAEPTPEPTASFSTTRQRPSMSSQMKRKHRNNRRIRRVRV